MTRTEKENLSLLEGSTNIFATIILVGFAFILIWVGQVRYQDFLKSHSQAAQKATSLASKEISRNIWDKRRLVDIFLRDHLMEISTLAVEPDNIALLNLINNKLGKMFPDFFHVNIATSYGTPIIDDFDGHLGELCIQDIKLYIEIEEQLIRIHPNPVKYHYDVLVSFNDHGSSKIFFVSFDLSELAETLRAVQPNRHKLMLVLDEDESLIEVTDKGGRLEYKNRLDFRLTEKEKSRILSISPVKGTFWYVVDLHEPGVLNNYLKELARQSIIIYLSFSLIVLILWRRLKRKENEIQEAQNKLLEKTELVMKLNNQLELSSITDPLTGLYNRRYLDKRLFEEWQRAMRDGNHLFLMLFDIDFFKQYNDTYGHQTGDTCLQEIANIMKQSFMRTSDIYGRYGGEEFMVIMTNINEKEALRAAERLREAMEKEAIRHSASQVSQYVTISGGLVGKIPQQEDSLTLFIAHADKALYEAKTAGRNRIVMNNL